MSHHQSVRLLIADDYETGRAVLSLHLSRCGYIVEQAGEGPQALEMALSGRFDLLLLDIEMPGMNGLEVLSKVRERFSQTELPVIMLSARDESPDVVAAFASGANDYVTKPIDLAVTEARIRAQSLLRFAAKTGVDVPNLSGVGSGEIFTELTELLPGTMLGPYRLEALLGKGAMGEVYRAVNEALERPVALKILQSNYDDPELLARFRREAKLAARIDHPNVVGVYEVGKWQGRSYLAMQLVEGESLAAKVERERRLAPEEALRLVRETAQGLAAAHAHGVIHRDIKPSNIVITADAVKLVDFGLARPSDTREGQLTQENRLVGTPEFMSPEQFAEKELAPPSDIYSLGVTWYLLLAGRAPFQEESTLLELALAHLNKPPEDIRMFAPEVSEETAELLAKMLAKDPLDRPADGGALLVELDKL